MEFLLSESPVEFLPIYLNRDCSLFAIVDVVDWEWAKEFRWSAKQSKKGPTRRVKWYAYRTTTVLGVKHSEYLHVEICKRAHGPRPRLGMVADHLNGESLFCRRLNLEWATRSKNRRNLHGQGARESGLWLSDTAAAAAWSSETTQPSTD